MVIGPNGEQLGVKPLSDALTLASAAGFDLVQMGGKPEEPVCKLMDYNKYKYEKNKKAKERRGCVWQRKKQYSFVRTVATRKINGLVSVLCVKNGAHLLKNRLYHQKLVR